jgi:hypothetical protein
MKYIKKIFEEQVIYSDNDLILLSDTEKIFLNTLPFERGDYVKLKLRNEIRPKIYQIKGISIEPRKNFANYSLFDLNNKFLHWFSAEKIEKIPDWEKDAMKYNL